MHEQLILACRRAQATVILPAVHHINIRVLDTAETAMTVMHLASETIFLSNDGTPTTTETLRRSRALTIGLIQHVVANHYGIERVGMNSMRRTKDVVLPRQVAMYLAKVMSSKSNGEVGRVFNRDPTTVWFGSDKIRRLMGEDTAFAAEVYGIRNKIEEMTK